jgi:hypothetical protein
LGNSDTHKTASVYIVSTDFPYNHSQDPWYEGGKYIRDKNEVTVPVSAFDIEVDLNDVPKVITIVEKYYYKANSTSNYSPAFMPEFKGTTEAEWILESRFTDQILSTGNYDAAGNDIWYWSATKQWNALESDRNTAIDGIVYSKPILLNSESQVVQWCIKSGQTVTNGSTIMTGSVIADSLKGNVLYSTNYEGPKTDALGLTGVYSGMGGTYNYTMMVTLEPDAQGASTGTMTIALYGNYFNSFTKTYTII